MEIDGIKVGIHKFDLSHPLVMDHLRRVLDESVGHSVMIQREDRGWRGKSHLRLHRDRQGFFVRQGRRSGCKRYLRECEVTFLDSKPTLFQFALG